MDLSREDLILFCLEAGALSAELCGGIASYYEEHHWFGPSSIPLELGGALVAVLWLLLDTAYHGAYHRKPARPDGGWLLASLIIATMLLWCVAAISSPNSGFRS